MKKNGSWMPLHIGDYLADTSHLTAEQHGAYLLLLMFYWRNGPLPDDDGQLATISRVGNSAWRKNVGRIIRMFFTEEDGRLHQKRADLEMARADNISDVRSTGGHAGAQARWKSEGDKHATRSQRLSEARKRGTHTDEEWEALMDICERRCVRCGASTIGNPVKDHIRPLYMSGSDSIENIQPMCRNCNSTKGSETTDYRPKGWRDKMPGKCLADAQQNACLDGRQNAIQTPGPVPLPVPLPVPKDLDSLEGEGSSAGAREASLEPPVSAERMHEVLVKLEKSLKTDAYPPGRRPVRGKWDQVGEVEKPRRDKGHLTPEQLAASRVIRGIKVA